MAEAILSASLYDLDREWCDSLCLQGLDSEHREVVYASLMGFGHISRVHRNLDTERILPRLLTLKSDQRLTGIIDDVLDDISLFVKN